MTIPDICRFPGYIFPKGRYEGETASGGYHILVRSEDYEGPAILDKKYAKEMRFDRARSVKDLVVIKHDPDGLHVAKNHYFDRLVSAYYAGNRPKTKRFPHWEDDWRAACSREQFGSNAFRKQGRGKKTHWFELRGGKSIVPVQELSELRTLKGQHEFFPASLYYQKGMPRTLYKQDSTDGVLPAYFKGETSLNTGQTRTVHIYLHGFTSPAKWHFGVLKHVLGIMDFGGNREDKKRWEAFEGKKVGNVRESVFDRCRTNSDRTSCNESLCRKKDCFSQIHPAIREYCDRYMKQVLAFFPKKTAKHIRIWNGNRFSPTADPKIVEVKCQREVRENPFSERHETLILRGYSYDWTSHEPALHLCMVTLYAGEYSTKPSPHTRTRFEKGTLLGYGKLRIL